MAFKRIKKVPAVSIEELIDSNRATLYNRYKTPMPVRAVDFETTSDMKVGVRQYNNRWHPDLDKIFGWQYCDEDGESFVTRKPVGSIDWDLQNFMRDTSIAKLAHNFKFELTQLLVENYSVPLETVWHDSIILSQLTNNLRKNHALDAVSWEMCGWDRKLDGDVHRLGRLYGGMQNVPKAMMREYQIADVQRSMLLFLTWWPEIVEDALLLNTYINEIQTVLITQIMEEAGLRIHDQNANDLIRECQERAEEAKDEALSITGGHFVNLNSDKDVNWFLYKCIGAPAIVRTATGQYSSRQDVLNEIIAHVDSPLCSLADDHIERIRRGIDIIQRWRAYSRGDSIIKGYLTRLDKDNVIHPSIRTNKAATGREACTDPNLQNVSKSTNPKTPYAVPARKCFLAPEDHVYVLKDQSGIELRLIIEAAQCVAMMDILKNGGHPHIEFCKIIYGKRFTSKAECRDLYQSGKNTHFALGYGGAVEKLAKTANLTLREMEAGYNLYAQRFPEIANLVRNGLKAVKETGFIITPFGRKLFIPADSLFAWLNYKIQGMAAEIIKRGQVHSMWYLEKEWGLRSKPIVPKPNLTIHDEIIFQIPLSIVKDQKAFRALSDGLDKCMTYVPEINVELEVESKITYSTWDNAEDLIW